MKIPSKKLLAARLAAIIGLSLVAAGSASAGSATANLAVSASVSANCTISTSPVAFGAYDPIVANAAMDLTASGLVTIACTKGSAPNITLGQGSNYSAGRRMAGGASFLNYELYQPSNTNPDAGSTCVYTTPTVWGTVGAQIFTPTAAGSKVARAYKVCGSVPQGQDPGVAASYTDTVVATVNF